LLGGITALAQSAWMGFALASNVLEQLRLAPAGILQRLSVVRPGLPRRVQLRGLLTREFSIGEASFILMASFFLSAGLGAVRQVLFNARFGISLEANAYYAAFRLPDTLFSLIAGGALSSAMIPVLLNAREQEGEAAGWRLISQVLTTLLAVFALLIVGVELFTPALVTRVLAPGFDSATSALTVSLTRVMLLQPMILLLGSVATAVLNSRNQFLLTGLSVVSHNISLIVSILAAGLIPGEAAVGVREPAAARGVAPAGAERAVGRRELCRIHRGHRLRLRRPRPGRAAGNLQRLPPGRAADRAARSGHRPGQLPAPVG
jgi:putative peptidoglycan lipid II flippase